MTSKHCFFNVMREDLRHKSWMLALSVLGNLLALPVAFLMSTGTGVYDAAGVNVEQLTRQAERIEGFFCYAMCITGGIIAIAGAFIVGLFGFRYVFHRNMVDTYHSMPVKRRTLFAAGWLNGFLIWFLPFLVNLLITIIIGENSLSTLRKTAEAIPGLSPAEREMMGAWVTGGGMILAALLSTLALTIAFLLVYHLVLLAVMLCGNVLNTLVAAAVLGGGAVSVYGMILVFCSRYLDTFMVLADNHFKQIVYASPIASSIYLLYQRAEAFQELKYSELTGVFLLNLLLMTAMGILALFAYLKRPSELAEQGIGCKPVKIVMQTVTSALAAMGGWMLFSLLAENGRGESGILAWGIFGALLAGIVVFGVMNIIFHMDFKAFFRHKILMVAVMGAGLLVCFGFYYDWTGYDSYLPEKEKIAEIAVCDYNCSNGSDYSQNELLDRMHITNQDVIYDFLEEAIRYTENGFPEEADEKMKYSRYVETVSVKVTLTNGKVYYRSYCISNYNTEPAYALMSSPEYMDVMFRLKPGDIAEFDTLFLERNGERQACLRVTEAEEAEQIAAICEAYNRDVEENPGAIISGGDRVLCSVALRADNYSYFRDLDVNDEMKHTIETMRELGFGEYVEHVASDEVQEIILNTNCPISDLKEGINLTEIVCQRYEVFPEELISGEDDYENSNVPMVEDVIVTEDFDENENIALHITDEAEIEELLQLISYSHYRQRNIFRKGFVEYITLVLKDGSMYDVYIPDGTLPEKYIFRFAKLQEELLRQVK